MNIHKPSKKLVIKSIGICAVAALAVYGGLEATKATVKAVTASLDNYATTRVLERDLIQKTPALTKQVTVEVPVYKAAEVDKQVSDGIKAQLSK